MNWGIFLLLSKAFNWIVGIIKWCIGIKHSFDDGQRARDDRKVADAIRDGDGKKIAEEWKERKGKT